MVIDLSTDKGARVAARLRDELVAWLVTVARDGTPVPTPVWFWWDGETLLVYSQPDKPKLRNIATNPRVALALRTDELGDDLAVITGEAAVDEAAPAALELPQYIEKYTEEIARLGSDPSSSQPGTRCQFVSVPPGSAPDQSAESSLTVRSPDSMPITRLNHAVLFVRDADAAADFYRSAFGFEELTRPQGMRAVFMRSPSGGNHHRPRPLRGRRAGTEAATRLGRALPPRLADRHDRGARRDVATPAGARGADRRIPTASPSRSMARTRTATSSRSCGRSLRRRGGSSPTRRRSCRSTLTPRCAARGQTHPSVASSRLAGGRRAARRAPRDGRR